MEYGKCDIHATEAEKKRCEAEKKRYSAELRGQRMRKLVPDQRLDTQGQQQQGGGTGMDASDMYNTYKNFSGGSASGAYGLGGSATPGYTGLQMGGSGAGMGGMGSAGYSAGGASSTGYSGLQLGSSLGGGAAGGGGAATSGGLGSLGSLGTGGAASGGGAAAGGAGAGGAFASAGSAGPVGLMILATALAQSYGDRQGNSTQGKVIESFMPSPISSVEEGRWEANIPIIGPWVADDREEGSESDGARLLGMFG